MSRIALRKQRVQKPPYRALKELTLQEAFTFNPNEYLQRGYARAVKGETVEDVKPGRKYKRVNVIGSLCEGKHYGIERYEHTLSFPCG
jgi:hypothetical protein